MQYDPPHALVPQLLTELTKPATVAQSTPVASPAASGDPNLALSTTAASGAPQRSSDSAKPLDPQSDTVRPSAQQPTSETPPQDLKPAVPAQDPQPDRGNHFDQQPTSQRPVQVAAANAPIATVGEEMVSVDSSNPGGVIVGGRPLVPGGSEDIIHKTLLLVRSSGLLIDGSKHPLPTPSPPATSQALLSLGSQTFTAIAQGGAVMIGSYALISGGTPVTVAGHLVSVGGQGIILDKTSSVSFITAPNSVNLPSKGTELTIGSQTFAVVTQGTNVAVIGSATLLAGGPAATIAGHPVSLGSQGLVVDGSQSSFPIPTLSSRQIGAQIITLGSQTYTAFLPQSGTVIIASTTLQVGGPPATISDHVFTLGTQGLMVDGQTTISLSNSPNSRSSTQDIAELILSGLGFVKASSCVAVMNSSSSLPTAEAGVESRSSTAASPSLVLSSELASVLLQPSGAKMGVEVPRWIVVTLGLVYVVRLGVLRI